MKRKIVKIDEERCDGCGECVTGCAEGALEVVDGKARIVREDFCDGFGDCIGTCPQGAITIEELDTAAFDESAVRSHLLSTGGEEAVEKMEEAHQRHRASLPVAGHSQMGGGCPGSRVRVTQGPTESPLGSIQGSFSAIPSELRQWPVALHLVPPTAPFFKNRELVVMSTCGPIASADIHWRFLRGRSVVAACPKLDDTRPYADKLAAILSEPTIPKVHVAIMEVPCCRGLSEIVEEAVRRSGRTDLAIEQTVIGLDGSLRLSCPLSVQQE